MKEIWKDIYFYDYLNDELIDYRGVYQASNIGRVKSLERTVWNGKGYRTVKEKIISPAKTNGRYLHVLLYKNQKGKTFLVHRLVCGTFVDNPNKEKYCNHKNEDIFDNRAENLEWCSIEYNNNYGTLRERMVPKVKEKLKNRSDLSKPVNQYTIDNTFVAWYQSISEAVRQLKEKENIKTSASQISKCCYGKIKTAAGYKWSFA